MPVACYDSRGQLSLDFLLFSLASFPVPSSSLSSFLSLSLLFSFYLFVPFFHSALLC